MLFTKEIGIGEIINQIMFGFVKKINFVFYLQRYPDTFLPLCMNHCVVFPFSVCGKTSRLANDVALWLPSS